MSKIHTLTLSLVVIIRIRSREGLSIEFGEGGTTSTVLTNNKPTSPVRLINRFHVQGHEALSNDMVIKY